MKKILVFVLVSLWAASSYGNSADTKDLPFLKKLSKSFFCLSAQGLKSFRCDVKVDSPDWLRKKTLAEKHIEGFLYAITEIKVVVHDKADGEVKVDLTPAPSTGRTDWDELLEQQNKNIPIILKGALKVWNVFNVAPYNSEEDFATCGYKVNRLKNGFEVIQKDDQGNILTSRFDKTLKLVYFSTKDPEGIIAIIRPHFKDSPQGNVLTDFTLQNDGMTSKGEFKYSKRGKYLLPEFLEMTTLGEDEKEKTGGVMFTFTNYRINP
jgi:hypothetical protein